MAWETNSLKPHKINKDLEENLKKQTDQLLDIKFVGKHNYLMLTFK